MCLRAKRPSRLFELKLREELDELGRNICTEVMEATDKWLKDNPKERKGWIVERTNEPKRVVTTFGRNELQEDLLLQ